MKPKTLSIAALGLTGALLIGISAPAYAGSSGSAAPVRVGNFHKPFDRDHRANAKMRDHRSGSSPASGGVKVGNGKPRKIPCYGNLC